MNNFTILDFEADFIWEQSRIVNNFTILDFEADFDLYLSNFHATSWLRFSSLSYFSAAHLSGVDLFCSAFPLFVSLDVLVSSLSSNRFMQAVFLVIAFIHIIYMTYILCIILSGMIIFLKTTVLVLRGV